MQKALGAIIKSIATVLIALFIITALLSLPLFNAGWHLLGPGLYKRALAEQNIYERFPALASEQIVYSMHYDPCEENPESEECLTEGQPGEEEESPEEGGPPPFLQNLTRRTMRSSYPTWPRPTGCKRKPRA